MLFSSRVKVRIRFSVPLVWLLCTRSCHWHAALNAGASKGTPGDAKCVTESSEEEEQKIKKIEGDMC